MKKDSTGINGIKQLHRETGHRSDHGEEIDSGLLRDLAEADLLSDEVLIDTDWEAAFGKFEKNIDKVPVIELKRSGWRQLMKIAAVLVLAIMAGLSYYYIGFSNDQLASEIILEFEDGSQKVIRAGEHGALEHVNGQVIGKQEGDLLLYDFKGAGEAKIHTLRVPYGQRFGIALADGSKVFLNSGTTLKFPSHFEGKGQRDVILNGEAYFEVTHNSQKPFVVKTAELHTKVYGTSFNVSAYEEDESHHVVLVEGSVGVYKEIKGNVAGEVLLKPDQRAYLRSSDQAVVKEQVKTDKYVAWKEGVLIFDNEKFETILHKLERHFDVSIENEYSEIDQNNYTGEFDNESLEEILKAFGSHGEFDYNLDGSEVRIRKK